MEGLPGSGKSTLAAKIADILTQKGQTVFCVDEGDANHPADFSNYDFVDFATERRLILEKWRQFVVNSDKNAVYVFNSIFLQNPMCETMMRFGQDEKESAHYIGEIAQIIRQMNPLIIYIDSPDVKKTVDSVLQERGENWLNAVIDYHTLHGYGKDNNLYGYLGYIQCLEERKKREKSILQSLKINYRIVSRDIDPKTLLN